MLETLKKNLAVKNFADEIKTKEAQKKIIVDDMAKYTAIS